MSNATTRFKADSDFLRLLKFSPFERRDARWRFGAKTISDTVVGRLIASGAAISDGDRLYLTILGASRS